ncbi:NADH:flavin oxidoreductase/NADH oxidase [Glycomyces artemisiae]|uniref:2,4-dienoyl-CoA reductase-like NADH-dependent reductase (Old Yellow Enzyme family) n=1 Tax=Glycomyces artemisiae TaxID=1076443 RepID=A0A2T0UF50_9ACTN|nr:NADH:flavin oxidoreductase/NADH oxidase [Glycomyces artemisiae]PRY56553.1 2,4-dienoyl-CoA reductase-like NADH-dependent reductase (Old Yellow Enzyme family) [Glycomyces artemisiae]
MTSNLFTPLTIRGTEFPNRAWMAPMCQYSADTSGPGTGAPNDWHVQHYGSRAVGGTGLILVEATAVTAEGRISIGDLGIWSDDQVPAHRRLTDLMRAHGTVPGVQLAHAGRKATSDLEFNGGRALAPDEGGWVPVAPSAVAFSESRPVPHALTREEIQDVVAAFAAAARRALAAGYEVVEIHGAHGYLLHEFLSPVSNRRDDEYGGSFENRTRLAVEVTDAVRAAVGETVPVFFRVSATDWIEPEGWTADETVRLAAVLREHGIDLLDVSSGGSLPNAAVPTGPGYQVPFAARVRSEAGLPAGAVGLITEARQAEKILADGEADAVLIGRELLRDPYWARHAAAELGDEAYKPAQYRRS